MLPQNHDLDMTPNGVPIVVNVSQYDVGREINFYLYNGSEVYTPAVGALIRIEGTKPDNTGFSYNATFIGNKVTMILTEQMTVLEGAIRCELRVTEGGSDVGSLNFFLQVEKAALRSDIPISDTEIPAIIELARAEQYNAEAWAVGQRNGQDVPPTDPTYHNNAKYWSENAQHGSLDALADVEITTPSDGQALLYDADNDEWINGNVSTADALGDLTDVTIATPSAGQVLTYDDNDNEWKNANIPTQSVGVEDLDDATITSLADGDILRYSSADSEWQNSDALSVAEGAIAQNASDIDDIDAEISAICNVYGSKNLLHPTNSSTTPNGATITYNADGTIAKSGTVSGGDAQFAFAVPTNADYVFPARLEVGRKYRLSGCPSGGSNSTYEIYIQFRNADNTAWGNAYHDYGDGVEFTAENARFGVYVRVFNGNTSTVTFSPMICDARIKDRTYVPYAPTNKDCMSYAANTKLGAHNRLPYPYVNTTKTVNKMTYTDMGDGTVKANSDGATTGAADFHCYYFNESTLPKGRYILSDGGASNGTVNLIANKHNGATYLSNLTRCDASVHDAIMNVTYDGYTDVRVIIYAENGASISNAIFKPMITLVEDTDRTFASYTMSNRELTENIINIISNTLQYKGILSASDNLNNIAQGIYLVQGASVSNRPSDISGWWHIAHIAFGGFAQQFILAGNYIYTRYYGGTPIAWSAWRKYTATVMS